MMKPNVPFSRKPEQFRFVNRFGPRFLKNRIRMMNQAAKYHRSWPVYVFLFAVTGLVTTMAAVEKHKNAPLVWETKKPVPTSPKKKGAVRAKAGRLAPASSDSKGTEAPKTVEAVIETPPVVADSVKDLTEIVVVDAEKRGRYAVRKGDRLYWVITPKMSFKELTELKQIVENETPYTFDFTQIKFDPFQVYIDVIGVNVHKEKGGSGSTSGGEESDEPIKSIGGYVSRTANGELGIGGMNSNNAFNMPTALEETVKADEKIVAERVAENRMSYFILKNQKPGPGGSRTINGSWLLENRGRRNEGLGVFVTAENKLQLYHPETITLLINGKEVNADELTAVKPEQLHTVIVKDVRDEAAGPGRQKRYVQLFLNQ